MRLNGTPLTDEEIAEAVAAWQEYGSIRAAARALEMAETSCRRRIHAAFERGLVKREDGSIDTDPVMPGFRINKVSTTTGGDGAIKSETIQQVRDQGDDEEHVFEMPKGHILGKGTFHVTADGNLKQAWLKTKQDYDVDWSEVFKNVAAEYEGRSLPTVVPLHTSTDYLNLIPCNDWHVNLLTWAREVGESWDLKIAERVIGEAMDTVIASARRAGTAVILGGGDLMHNDDNTNRTAKSGNVLDADGRHSKGMEVTLRLMVRAIDTALAYNDHVVVRILKGNHDEQSSVAISYFLYAWYSKEPRVEVDLDQSLFWYYEFGKVMLAATHGHTVKLKEMPQIMAHRRAEMWGRTKFRFAHGFHVHHKEVIAKEDGGVICESHQAPIPQDSWHYGSGYLSARSVQIITYHKDRGEWGRRVEPIMDAVIQKPTDFLEAA